MALHRQGRRWKVVVAVVIATVVVGGGLASATANPVDDPTRFTGTNFWESPDDPSLDITGDIDIRVAAALDDWTSGTETDLVAKYSATGNQRSYDLLVLPTGRLQFAWSTAGTAASFRSALSSVAPSVADGALLLLRVTLDVNNGSGGHDVTFFTKPSTPASAAADVASDSGWTQLGTVQTGAGTTSIFSGTARLTIAPHDANLYAVVIKNGINGTTVANPAFGSQPDGETNFTDGAGRAWTEQGHVAHRWRANGNANDSIGANHGTLLPLVNGATASGTPAAEGSNSFSLDGVDDRVEMPDVSSHYFSGSFTIQAWVRTEVTGLQWVVTKHECGGASPATCANSFYRLGLDGNGSPFGDLRDSDGGGPDASSNSQGVSAGTTSIANGQFHHLRFVRDVDADLLAIYVDGALAGLEELHPGAAGPLANDDGGADPLVVGAIYDSISNNLNSFFSGQIDDVQLSGEGAVSPSDFAPTLTGVDPDSPANDNNPEIKGNAIGGSTVNLYTNSACTGSPVATGSAANFASPGLTVDVGDDSTTTFFATATPRTGTGSAGTTESACSTSSITYTEQTTVPAQFLTDQTIKGSKTPVVLGDGTYNTTGAGQTVLSKTKRGKKAIFNITVQNDGTDPDSFAVIGCAKSRGFKVSYLDGATNITSQITGAGYSTGTFAPGATKAIRLAIKVKSTGPKKKTCTVTATSQSLPSSQDVVIGKVKAKG